MGNYRKAEWIQVYYSLKADLVNKIERGFLGEGDKLPSEHSLAREYNTAGIL